MIEPKHAAAYPHYYRDVKNLTHVDVYRVLQLFGVTDQAIGHAIKKLLVAGARGMKAQMGMTMAKDVREAIVTLERWEEMQLEQLERPEPMQPVITNLLPSRPAPLDLDVGEDSNTGAIGAM